ARLFALGAGHAEAQVVHAPLADEQLAGHGAAGDLVADVVAAQLHVVRVEVRIAELAAGEARDEVAAVVELDVDVGHRIRAEGDAGRVGLVHAQHDVGVLAAGATLRGGAVQVAGQGQVVGGLPLAVDAVQRCI